MHKNIRRTVAVAATATGLLAFGAAGANAEEAPDALPVSLPDHAIDVPDLVGGLTGAVGDTVGGVVGGVTGQTPQPHAPLPTTEAPAPSQSAPAHTPAPGHTTAPAHTPSAAAPSAPSASPSPSSGGSTGSSTQSGEGDDVIDYLFGPLDLIPGYADAGNGPTADTAAPRVEAAPTDAPVTHQSPVRSSHDHMAVDAPAPEAPVTPDLPSNNRPMSPTNSWSGSYGG
ncbi:hypothetical protein [Streptomyces sp. NPDC088725]|uniref:hypothetical protein n=1 Tax=Streptomyces sp. NPDC088725 TaxID=3365873 RepID=UPI00381AA154